METLEQHYTKLVALLLNERNERGFWTGKLSSSALGTSVAIVALKINGGDDETQIESGLQWLLNNINNDGGFGDSPESMSNVSTTLLSYAAITYCQTAEIPGENALAAIERYLATQHIHLGSEVITSSILKFYGKDYTFSVPILSMLVICGVLDATAIQKIPQLPFELTLFPAPWYKFFNLQVVSYAIPALVAVGIFIHKHRKYYNPVTQTIRNKSIAPAIKKLEAIMPESGGFLEAIPLTGFVCMCLITSNIKHNEIVNKGIGFLRQQQRADGSWPIDTDLSTWVTTLSIKALSKDLPKFVSNDAIDKLKTHLLSIQYTQKHAFNQAMPGGWGWTSFSGSVPDVDDTSGAILALLEMYGGKPEETQSIINGCIWLTSLQNNDGGFPTFCRGWSRLPFDSSCADLTGHALAALATTLQKLGDSIPARVQKTMHKSIAKAALYLEKVQHENGSWLPLWFGNQHTVDKRNPVYGTAKVTVYLEDCLLCSGLDKTLIIKLEDLIKNARKYLLTQQNNDGSWGGAKDTEGTIEETSLAICALAKSHREACLSGFQWLQEETANFGIRSKPIGLYFAMLWYDEKLYPMVYYVEALRRVLARVK